MSLKPIKRSEMILDGQDIEPATRLEYFLKKAAEGGGGGASDLIRGTMSEADEGYDITLDKTYKECVNLIDNGVNSIYVTSGVGIQIFQIVSYRKTTLGKRPVYQIDVIIASPTGELSMLSLITNSENDYPNANI